MSDKSPGNLKLANVSQVFKKKKKKKKKPFGKTKYKPVSVLPTNSKNL